MCYRRIAAAWLLIFCAVGWGCRPSRSAQNLSPVAAEASVRKDIDSSDPLALIPHPQTVADRIVNGAKGEARRGVLYDATYRRMAYPNGDVPANRGACTDVIIRALRNAGIDLQQRIHEDMKQNWGRYPHVYGLKQTDANIDHRRTTNQITFLRRRGMALPTDTTGAVSASWQPGDLVYWRLPGGSGHCGVCSSARNPDGLPLVIHNIGPRATQEDCLTAWTITAHFRYPSHLIHRFHR